MLNVLRGRRQQRVLALIMAVVAMAMIVGTAAAKSKTFEFGMVRSSAAEAAKCLPKAEADVKVTELGPVEILDLKVEHLAPNTVYSFFVLQVPDKPFGIGWYNGEVETNAAGKGQQRFIGRFNDETFAIAQDAAAAPVVHDEKPFPDAAKNPAFNPIHTFHLGLWFSDPADAAKAGCGNGVTPFDGDHVAGIQVLSTKQFKPYQGPLRKVAP